MRMAKPPSTPSRSRKARSSNVVPIRSEAPPAGPAPGIDRERRIAERAYQLAEQRGFVPGGELEDWLAAEREIDRGGPARA
jgi:hypothetical protein